MLVLFYEIRLSIKGVECLSVIKLYAIIALTFDEVMDEANPQGGFSRLHS